MNGLLAPVILDQGHGQPVEQLGVSGHIAGGAKIAGRGDDSLAHMLLPDAVDDDAREKAAGTFLFVGNPIGKGDTRFGFLGIL